MYNPYVQPPPYYGKPRPHRNIPKVIAIAAVPVFAILVLVILAVAGVQSHEPGSTPVSSNPSTAKVWGGTSDDWFAAVCRFGSLRTDLGTRLPNATSGGFCVSKVDGHGIDIGQYNSGYAARSDGARSVRYWLLRDDPGYGRLDVVPQYQRQGWNFAATLGSVRVPDLSGVSWRVKDELAVDL